jgi:hypothetical protein
MTNRYVKGSNGQIDDVVYDDDHRRNDNRYALDVEDVYKVIVKLQERVDFLERKLLELEDS